MSIATHSVASLASEPNSLAPHYRDFRVAERLLLTGHSHQAWPDCARDGMLACFHDAAQHVDDNFARLFATHALSLLALRPAIIDVRAPAIAIVPTFISLDPRAEAKLGRLIIDDVLL